MTDSTITLAMLGDLIEELPEDWRIEIRLERGMFGLSLFAPNDRNSVIYHEVPEKDDDEFGSWILRAVNVARRFDGLGRVEWEKSTCP